MRAARRRDLGIPAEIDGQLPLIEKAAAEAELRAGVLKIAAARLGEVEIRRGLDVVGEAIGHLDGCAPHRLARQRAFRGAFLAVAAAVGNDAVERFNLQHAALDRLSGIDLELERVELRRSRARADQEEQGVEKQQATGVHCCLLLLQSYFATIVPSGTPRWKSS